MMPGTTHWMHAALIGAFALAGCSRSDEAHTDHQAEANSEAAAAAKAPPPVPPMGVEEARIKITEAVDSANKAFRQVRSLRVREKWQLRRDVNATQIATAQSLGVRASGDEQIQRLVQQGRLTALPDSTPFWVFRNLQHSVPFVTPDTRQLLNEIGRRFHTRLDSLGLPPYRMQVTSVLRTPESQADLRKRNPNASRTVSAHEYGTTLDISHVRFAAPAESWLAGDSASAPALPPEARQLEVEMLEEAAEKNAVALQAELGRVLAEMRAEGMVKVMMERQQPVYHMTVARRISGGTAAR